jgi:hypothetical protein
MRKGTIGMARFVSASDAAVLFTLMLLGLAAAPGAAATVYVSPTGDNAYPGTETSPFRTIQAAIDHASAGDTVVLEDGTYTGDGDRDLDFGGKSLIVTSRHGADRMESKTVIDCGGTADTYHRGFSIHSKENRAIIRGLTIKNGYSSDGGAVAVENDSQVVVDYCTLTGNTGANSGGAVYNNGGTVTIAHCEIERNTTNGPGGGVSSQGTVSLSDCLFYGNRSADLGGAIASGGPLQVAQCTFRRNVVASGGGGALSSAGNAVLTNCQFWDNRAGTEDGTDGNSGSGGAVNNLGTMTITHCTFSVNRALGRHAQGGALENTDTVTLTNDILWGDSAPAGAEIHSEATERAKIIVTYSDVQGGYSGKNNLQSDPRFVDAAGGSLLLLVGSPCLHAGVAVPGVTTDIGGKPRAKKAPTIGAYEGAPKLYKGIAGPSKLIEPIKPIEIHESVNR